MSAKPALGILMMVAASVCFSLGGLLIKLIPWNPLAINGARNLIASCVIGLYILCTRHRLKWNFTVFVGAVSMAGVTTLFAIANKLTTAGNTIILQYTAPVWIILLMMLFFGKRPGRLELITIVFVLAGILCFFYEGLSAGRWLGDLLALLSGIFYAGVFMLNQFERGDALSSMFFGQLACGIFLSPSRCGRRSSPRRCSRPSSSSVPCRSASPTSSSPTGPDTPIPSRPPSSAP
ncbi:MAG: DMT family transporter [Lachnospiraceae bacterium]|nr:DMT family transporter [Lachnospiraceae bacterium]